ncbi:MAG: xanthine dehydrogenase small subunit [Myxococcota bacterium]|nr:xanthine dehydrogenase small subunit [Myxococcota bacterium]
MEKIEFTVNGQVVCTDQVSPNTTLLQFLRNELDQTGTKEGCAEGDCGACTVAILDAEKKSYRAINSCLVLLPMVHGKEVVTVEGLQDPDGYHPVQDSLVEELGSQCGYCTPGIIMSMFEACYRNDLDEDWKLNDQMCGNLCRCTGYRPILDATKKIAGLQPTDRFANRLEEAPVRSGVINYSHLGERYIAPARLDKLWDILENESEAQIISGGTDLSLLITKKFQTLPFLVSLESIDELRFFRDQDNFVEMGSTLTLSELEESIAPLVPAVGRMLRFFGARQIKNRATLGGNLCTASPIGDLPPILIALGAEAVILSRAGERAIPLEDFFVDYRKTALKKGEILGKIRFPKPGKNSRVIAYKVSKRQELDISTVSAGLFVELSEHNTINTARFCFGGMAATPKRAANVEKAVLGKVWNQDTVSAAVEELEQDFKPLSDHRGSAWYRTTVAKNLLRAFQLESNETSPDALPVRPVATVQIGGLS